MMTEFPVCPRCKHYIPNDERPGEYPGALSRYDNESYVCSRCGELEAMSDFFDLHVPPLHVDLSQRIPTYWGEENGTGS